MSGDVGGPSPFFARTLEDLRDDALRRKGTLERIAVDTLYQKRGVSPEEAVLIDRALAAAGVEIVDAPEEAVPELEPEGESSGSAFDSMLRRARGQPLLTRAEERDCGVAIQLARTLDPEDREAHAARIRENAGRAKTKLVARNVRLAVHAAYTLGYRDRLELDDLVQLGLIGVMTAAERFDPSWETKFSTYAMWWIRQAMSRGVANDGATVRVPVHMVQAIAGYRRTAARLTARGVGKTSMDRQVAEIMGWTEEYAAKVATFAERRTISLDDPGADDAGSGLAGLLVDTGPGPEEIAIKEDEAAWARRLVAGLTNERLEEIVSRRFGFDDDEDTLETIGRDHGVSRQRIQQLEAEALRILSIRAERERDGEHD